MFCHITRHCSTIFPPDSIILGRLFSTKKNICKYLPFFLTLCVPLILIKFMTIQFSIKKYIFYFSRIENSKFWLSGNIKKPIYFPLKMDPSDPSGRSLSYIKDFDRTLACYFILLMFFSFFQIYNETVLIWLDNYIKI